MDPDSVDGVGRVPHGSSDDPDVLDLSANINPRTPDGTRAVYRDAFEAARSYPNDGYHEFRAAAADYVGCRPGSVVPLSGGLAAIRLAIGVTVSPGDRVLLPAPSFGEYAREVRLAGGEAVVVPHDAILERDPSGYAMAIVCTPNNPTGECPPEPALRSFADRCEASGTVLLADEAFLGFTDRRSLAGHPAVVVARSLTKLFGLPGLRAGFAVADGEVGERLRAARPAWSVGGPAAAVGAHVMRDSSFVEATRRRVETERDRLRAGLEARGFDVHPSIAPFVLCDVGKAPAGVLSACRDRGVVLRDATTFRGLDRHVRIAVRSREATERLLSVLDGVR
ncbi:threonine-phosphate decarboxylase CobD [Natronomonas sp. LN261]|uniref:threonine-phosphate decarboxylase CobD n=1 Tax=Natronomonas sp. LN261 TaxID=2750669 RepID=UPI0015EF5A40|nr:threonine-phosphate decarboxylase CobD [Natronomonas sp. LN261]